MSVVIVDDHAAFRASARALLEAGGLRVTGEAATGSEALALVRMLDPDVVLLDIQLPDMDGIEVADRLSRLDHVPATVLTSSHDARDFGRRLVTARARGFVPKAELSVMRIAALVGAPG